MSPIDAALEYARRFGWHMFPTRDKRPLTPNGFKDATSDLAIIAAMWQRWPDAEPAAATGAVSGIVVLDIDIDSEKGISGLDALDDLGIATHPQTRTAHTTRGGLHLFFAHPGYDVPNSAGKIGRGVDVRGDGGYVVLPGANPRRTWDPHLGLDTPLLPMPDWMVIREPERGLFQPEKNSRPACRLSPYAEGALDGAVKTIVSAPHGQQQETLNREAFSIGRLAGSGAIPAGLALEALQWAAHQMVAYDARKPWRAVDIDRMVNRSFAEGLRQPRGVPR
jgi:putative DNA primase/helicase